MATPTSTPSTSTTPVTPLGVATGKTVISDGVIAKVAGIAAREVPGVFALGGGAARALGALRSVVNSTDLSQGINIEVGETQVAVDVTIVAEYPIALQSVAEDVRASVTDAIETIIGMEVAEVNVTVTDVHFASDDADETEESRVL
ncbi:Asp23/Gls24 family envelope stress response protein [Amnibacterium flavum]|uniref:Asp23/Gls24 family envelope stress response protein n=1 Tax=Amnibacterium flavum TaxID=2173173 RepID=A0A2V1HXE7_9MICO|nr:Asp23/Gls24 family envelope stress response protein [Amnibacterium flavum]PVZ95989.1 Asp23/Gls24 family envelope stress response protein [Amnibacterium flavum]